MIYLLDTNALSAAMRDWRGPVARRMRREQVMTSIVCVSEARFGFAKKPDLRTTVQFDQLLEGVPVLAFETPADRYYADIRADLERRGLTIGANDMLIAAHTLAVGATLVTDNIGEFARVPGLRVENWLRD